MNLLRPARPRAAALQFASALALASVLCAGNVLRVGPGRPFATIQQALATAADGDLILVDPGSYPAFVIDTKAVAVLAAQPGTPFTLLPNPAGPVLTIRNVGAGRSVTVDGFDTAVASGTDAAVVVDACAGAVRLRSFAIEPTGDLVGVPMRALVEVRSSAAVSLVDPRIMAQQQRRGSTTRGVAVGAGVDDGLAGILAIDSGLHVVRGRVAGFDNLGTPSAGRWGGDAIRVRGSSALRMDDAPSLFVGGAGGEFGGSAVHHVDPIARMDVRSCGVPVGAFVPGSGPLRGGYLGRNHDRGFVVPGAERYVPGCLQESAAFVSTAAQVSIGSAESIDITSFYSRAFTMLLAPSGFARIAPVDNTLFLDLGAPPSGTLASGFISSSLIATVALPVPNDPNLVGLQFAVQAVVGPALGVPTSPVLSFSLAQTVVVVP